MELLDDMVVLLLLQSVFQSGFTNLHSHQQRAKVFLSICSPTFGVSRLFDDGHVVRCEKMSHFVFDLPFSDD